MHASLFIYVGLCYVLAVQFSLTGLTIAYSVVDRLLETPMRTTVAPDTFSYNVTQWDGQWYVRVLQRGYDYHSDVKSSVAFFPAYPLIGRGVARLTGLSGHWSAWLVGQACLIAGYVQFLVYLHQRQRWANNPVGGVADNDDGAQKAWILSIGAMAFYPPSFFFSWRILNRCFCSFA